MTYSPLTVETMPPIRQAYGPKCSARPDGVVINGLIVHHHATTGEGGIERLVRSSDKASANYIIRTNGSLIGSVPEEYRAWTSGSYAADDDKITVEVQNSTGAPDWQVSDAALTTLIRLYADIATRYNFSPDRTHISGHRNWAATSCPGPYLYGKLGDIAAQANGEATPAPIPAPIPTPIPASIGDINVTTLPTLKKGSKGLAVKRVQGLLLANGYGVGNAGIDGDWGPGTDAGFRSFQSSHPTTGTNGHPDGICGPKTWAALLGL